MKKRGQLTIFVILGLLILIVAAIFLYVNSRLSESIKEEVTDTSRSFDIAPVKNYITACLKKVSDDALFDKIGLHGGYVDMAGVDSTLFLGEKVPYYLDGTSENYPSKGDIENFISSYIVSELDNCLDLTVFTNIGLDIEKTANIIVSTSINEEDVTIKLNYPLKIKQKDKITMLTNFRVNLPVRLGKLYESATKLVDEIKSAQPNEYDISGDCDEYDKNGLTNVYSKNNDDGDKEIIQFMDFSTYEQNYLQTYVFQFAVKNVDFTGNCVG